MKKLIPLMVAVSFLFVLLVGMGPAPVQASGPCLSSASVTPMVVAAKVCPPKYKWNSSKKCCWNGKKCKCKDGKVWNQARFKCVKKK